MITKTTIPTVAMAGILGFMVIGLMLWTALKGLSPPPPPPPTYDAIRLCPDAGADLFGGGELVTTWPHGDYGLGAVPGLEAHALDPHMFSLKPSGELRVSELGATAALGLTGDRLYTVTIGPARLGVWVDTETVSVAGDGSC